MPKYYEFRVSLVNIEPEIWRKFLLPITASFATLHEAIQDSLGWDGAHLFEFRDKGGRKTIASCDSEGDPWADEPPPRVDKLKLASFFERAGTKCRYVYDFGDDWNHVVQMCKTVELPEKFKRRLLDGARACPPEDSGGVWGYEEYVKIAGMSEDDIAKLGDDAADRKEWIGDWDPEAFDLAATKKEFDK